MISHPEYGPELGATASISTSEMVVFDPHQPIPIKFPEYIQKMNEAGARWILTAVEKLSNISPRAALESSTIGIKPSNNNSWSGDIPETWEETIRSPLWSVLVQWQPKGGNHLICGSEAIDIDPLGQLVLLRTETVKSDEKENIPEPKKNIALPLDQTIALKVVRRPSTVNLTVPHNGATPRII